MRARPFALFLGEVIASRGFKYLTQIPITKPVVVLLKEMVSLKVGVIPAKAQTSQTQNPWAFVYMHSIIPALPSSCRSSICCRKTLSKSNGHRKNYGERIHVNT